ncbi:ABC transporter permease [Saccharopolyspora phatthalungensis]|uniref:Peptide/nickel transport system permease protein n=1 Tax=Saccharopolyspora phatthalungensis TaxID=664693 RepID=A0A840QJH6_9PSEU|nr:ABC transporter permease [Saccharopolyspora phatthalungensis]MBB5159358.1 peptide/nickel transport system permease protein [Saccharopolyspora phatthalungensis]
MSTMVETPQPVSVFAGAARRLRGSWLLSSKTGKISAAMVLIALLVVVLAPLLAPFGLDEQGRTSFAGPTAAHLLGTDQLGRDLLSRLIYAIRLDMVIALIAIPLGGIVGTLLGLSGVLAPWLGQVTSRIFDVIIGFPTLVLGIALALVLTPGTTAVIVAIAVINLPVFGRLARGGMLSQLGRDYVIAARSLGASRWRLLWRHVLPNIRSAILVQGAIAIADAVFVEGALSILGVGVQPPEASLGSMVQAGLPYIADSPLSVLAPTIALAWIILGFALMADTFNNRASR